MAFLSNWVCTECHHGFRYPGHPSASCVGVAHETGAEDLRHWQSITRIPVSNVEKIASTKTQC